MEREDNVKFDKIKTKKKHRSSLLVDLLTGIFFNDMKTNDTINTNVVLHIT